MTTELLTPQQHRIISLLAEGKSITEAAETENLHRNTLTNWRRTLPAFARELDFALTEQHNYWQEQATRLAPLAMQAIEDCLTNPNSSPSLRFRAATYIMKMATTTATTSPIPQAPPQPSEPLDEETQFHQIQKAALLHKIAQLGSFDLPESEPSATELGSFESAPSAESAAPKLQPIRVTPKPGRNDQCPCGSNQKYKRCCIDKAA